MRWVLRGPSHLPHSQIGIFYSPFNLGKGSGKALIHRQKRSSRAYPSFPRLNEDKTRKLGAGGWGLGTGGGSQLGFRICCYPPMRPGRIMVEVERGSGDQLTLLSPFLPQLILNARSSAAMLSMYLPL